MSQHIVIEGAKPYDGRYELDLDQELTTREWGWIKRHAGYLPLGLSDDAFGDPELICVLAAIAIRRAGRIGPTEVAGVIDRLADVPFGSSITIHGDPEEEEQEENPPPASSNSNDATSGAASPTSSATSASNRKRTGTQDSAPSASAPLTSVN